MKNSLNYGVHYIQCFIPDRNDYQYIWFYPYSTHQNVAEWVGVDDVTLEPLDLPISNQTITCGGSATLCIPCPSVNSEVKYLWSTGETTSCITVSPLVTTIYTVSVSVVSAGNVICGPYNIPVTVTVGLQPGPVTMSSGNQIICGQPATETYCFSSSNATSYSYSVYRKHPTKYILTSI